MKYRAAVAYSFILSGLLLADPASAIIVVSVEPAFQSVNITDGTAAVGIVADIPEADAIVGWGLDLTLVGISVSIDNVAINEATFVAVFAPDMDGLAGLVPLDSVFGDDILLATITLSLDALGTTDFFLSDDNPDDPTEGFALDPPPVGQFADVDYIGGQIEVVPEPATSALLFMGFMVLLSRKFSLRRAVGIELMD